MTDPSSGFYGLIGGPPDERRNVNAFRPPPTANKPINIDCLYHWELNRYQVVNITNTAWYKPGDMLTEEIIGEISKIPNWTINIGPYQLMKKIWDFIGPKLSLL
jgi:hypothetical protein